jgi:hypothetical protein
MAPDLGWDEQRVAAEAAAWFEEAREEGIDAGAA